MHIHYLQPCLYFRLSLWFKQTCEDYLLTIIRILGNERGKWIGESSRQFGQLLFPATTEAARQLLQRVKTESPNLNLSTYQTGFNWLACVKVTTLTSTLRYKTASPNAPLPNTLIGMYAVSCEYSLRWEEKLLSISIASPPSSAMMSTNPTPHSA